MAFNIDKGREATENRLRANGFKVRKDDPRDGFTARVRVAMDGSGSTRALWLHGAMQAAIQAVFPTALAVDDDGNMPVAVFNEGARLSLLRTPMTRSNFERYVESYIVDHAGNERIPLFGGTDYSPVLHAILKDERFIQPPASSWFRKAGAERFDANPNGVPTLIYFFTDGACSDEDAAATRNLMLRLSHEKAAVYILFIGIGDASSFRFIRQLADAFTNVGFIAVSDVAKAVTQAPEAIAEMLLPSEMLSWLKR